MLRGGRGRAGPAHLSGLGGAGAVPTTDDADGQAGRPRPEAARTDETDVAVITALAAVLTLATGATDVVSFIRLGGVFASVMTGNLVLLGLAIGRSGALAAHAVVAFAGYAAGVAAGTRLMRAAGSSGPPNRAPRAALLMELVLLAGFAVGWELTGAAPHGGAQLVLLAVAATAMGIQSAAARGLGPQVATTFLTGTVTSVVMAWVTPGRRSKMEWRDVLVLVALVAGAAAGALVIANAAAALPAIQLTALALVIGVVRTLDGGSGQPDASE
jgi:uncharacterized membrane protein YoaK (UPF0700 family)